MRIEGVSVSSNCPDLTAHIKRIRKAAATRMLTEIKMNKTDMLRGSFV
jgi:hypothetical protein